MRIDLMGPDRKKPSPTESGLGGTEQDNTQEPVVRNSSRATRCAR